MAVAVVQVAVAVAVAVAAVPWRRTAVWKEYVKLVFVIHVGGTRGVPSSTDNIMKRLARITLTVEFIRTFIFLFLFYV